MLDISDQVTSKLKVQNSVNGSFKPLPMPPRRPFLGLALIWLGHGLPLLILSVAALLGWFIYQRATVGRIDFTTDFPYFQFSFFIIMVLLFIQPFLTPLVSRGHALRQMDAVSLLAKSAVPPVLYLRSSRDAFLEDTTPVFPGFIDSVPTYEQRLKKALHRLGPLIAVDRPGETFPPSGAAHVTVSNAEWQQAVEYYMQKASTVVILFGPGEDLFWGVRTALRQVRWERLLFFFPYVYPAQRSDRWRYRFILGTNLHRLLVSDRKTQEQMDGERKARYRMFREKFQAHLPYPLPESLGDACFLTLTRHGQPQLLKTKIPPTRGHLLDARLVSEMDFEWTLHPFVERMTGHPQRLPFRARIIQNKLMLFSLLLLSLGAIGSGCLLSIMKPGYGWLPFVGGGFLLNYSIACLRASSRNR